MNLNPYFYLISLSWTFHDFSKLPLTFNHMSASVFGLFSRRYSLYRSYVSYNLGILNPSLKYRPHTCGILCVCKKFTQDL